MTATSTEVKHSHEVAIGVTDRGAEQPNGAEAASSRAYGKARATVIGSLRSQKYVNVSVCGEQMHLQYLDTDAASIHFTKGIGIWPFASSDRGQEPDLVMASAGDIPTNEALAAVELLRQECPDLKSRLFTLVELVRLQPETEHPYGLSDRDSDSLFTADKPINFAFHGYPWLVHRLADRRRDHVKPHVRGCKEWGNISTPVELAIQNQLDRFGLAMDVIDRVPKLGASGAPAKKRLRDLQIECEDGAHEHGVDKPDAEDWTWSC